MSDHSLSVIDRPQPFLTYCDQQSISNRQENNSTTAFGIGWDKCKDAKSAPKVSLLSAFPYVVTKVMYVPQWSQLIIRVKPFEEAIAVTMTLWRLKRQA
jgi:hypothetical protein